MTTPAELRAFALRIGVPPAYLKTLTDENLERAEARARFEEKLRRDFGPVLERFGRIGASFGTPVDAPKPTG